MVALRDEVPGERSEFAGRLRQQAARQLDLLRLALRLPLPQGAHAVVEAAAGPVEVRISSCPSQFSSGRYVPSSPKGTRLEVKETYWSKKSSWKSWTRPSRSSQRPPRP